MELSTLREFATCDIDDIDCYNKIMLSEANTKQDDGFKITMNDYINDAEKNLKLAESHIKNGNKGEAARDILRATKSLTKGKIELNRTGSLTLFESFVIAAILSIVPCLLIIASLTGITFIILSISKGIVSLPKAAMLKLFGIKTRKGTVNNKDELNDAYDVLIKECKNMAEKLK